MDISFQNSQQQYVNVATDYKITVKKATQKHANRLSVSKLMQYIINATNLLLSPMHFPNLTLKQKTNKKVDSSSLKASTVRRIHKYKYSLMKPK